MADYPLFPNSPVIDSPVDAEIVAGIAEEARQAFFATVVNQLDSLYPGSKTWGDETPGEMYDRDRIARTWVESFAWNNTEVQRYNGEPCVLRDWPATDPTALGVDSWPDDITSVTFGRPAGSAPFYPVTIRGTRSAIHLYVTMYWGEDEAEEAIPNIYPDTEVSA